MKLHGQKDDETAENADEAEFERLPSANLLRQHPVPPGIAPRSEQKPLPSEVQTETTDFFEEVIRFLLPSFLPGCPLEDLIP
ncbi:hypothetical protein D3C75_1047310 [compost metagenome]